MFFYVFVVFYTQSLVLMLQYHISPTIHSTVPLFTQYVILSVCCILHTLTSTNVTISHINNQTFYHSLVYTVCTFMCVVFYTQSLILMLQYHISTTKHSTIHLFIRYVLLCVRCILHTITSTNVTISHINNQTFYHSLVYSVCSFMCLLYCTHNH
jgi:hypothetical protein